MHQLDWATHKIGQKMIAPISLMFILKWWAITAVFLLVSTFYFNMITKFTFFMALLESVPARGSMKRLLIKYSNNFGQWLWLSWYVVTSADTRDPQFKSSHRPNFMLNRFTVNCWKDKNEEKEARIGPFKKHCLNHWPMKSYLSFVFFKNWPIKASFCLFSSFYHYNFNNANWKKFRLCAWDLNPLATGW